MSKQLHGSQFLLRRLQRAAAIPAAERLPDVAAFVESVQLLREACDLLPLTSDGRPAMQLGSAKNRQQAILALLKAARADYLCPQQPVTDTDASFRLAAWCRHPNRVSGGRLTCLTTLLLNYTSLQYTLFFSGTDVSVEAVHATAAAMLDQLADPAMQQVLSGQLAQVAAANPGQPLLSFKQLHHACCCAVVNRAHNVCSNGPSGLPRQAEGGGQQSGTLAQRRAAASIVTRAGATILSLEPHTPKSCHTAAIAQLVAADAAGEGPAAEQHFQKYAEVLLQGARLAKQQGNMYFIARCAAAAVMHYMPRARADCTGWQAAIAAFEGAEAAVHACKRLLPARWADGVAASVHAAQQSIQIVQAQLHTQHSAGSAAASFAELAELRDVAAAAVGGIGRLGMCDGCGQHAVGLRRCARCKTAQYCSTECQHKHWRTHKRECRAA